MFLECPVLIRMLFPAQQSIHRYILKTLKQWCVCNQISCTETNGKGKKKIYKPPYQVCVCSIGVCSSQNSPAHVQTRVTLQTVTDGETTIIAPMKAHRENYSSKLLKKINLLYRPSSTLQMTNPPHQQTTKSPQWVHQHNIPLLLPRRENSESPTG